MVTQVKGRNVYFNYKMEDGSRGSMEWRSGGGGEDFFQFPLVELMKNWRNVVKLNTDMTCRNFYFF